jgi:hypothetical protein
MRRAPYILLCLAALMAAGAGRAAIIDRIAVSVGNRVITATDLDREIRITAFLNNTKPDFSAANKRTTAGRMVDQTLLRAEIEVSRYLSPTPGDVDAGLKEVKSRYPDEAAYRAAMAPYGISEDDLKAMLLWQLTLVRFIDARFRPGIQIGEPEIRKYFDEHLGAFAQATPGKSPALDDYRDRIEQTLTGDAANVQVEQWLKDARERTHIEYHEEVFR